MEKRTAKDVVRDVLVIIFLGLLIGGAISLPQWCEAFSR